MLIAFPAAVILLGGLAIATLLYILLTPLVLGASLEKQGSILTAQGTAGWGFIAIHLTWAKGSGTASLALKGKRVVERVISVPVKEGEKLPGEERVLSGIGEVNISLLSAWSHTLGRLIVLIFRHLKQGSLSCSVILGFPKAWITGTVYGYYWAVRSFLWPFSCLSIHMTPYFDGAKCDGEINLYLEVRHPLVLVVRMFQVLGVRSLLRFVTPKEVVHYGE